jgi:malic enzyme
MIKLAFVLVSSLLLSGCATISTLAIVGAGAAVVGASANVYRATKRDRVIIVDQSGRPLGQYDPQQQRRGTGDYPSKRPDGSRWP